ncbi:MAG TPA: hypothetical protein VFB63_32410, partial [Bryobacteraceae bacterium]|nr:hypothetical protein [Bryobacteraceae bacterium]
MLDDVAPANLATHAGVAKKRFPELAQFIDQLQATINSIVVSLQKYRIGELSLVKILSATGKQIGWLGVNGNTDGIAIQTLRAYEDGAQIGTGRLNAPAQISAGATNLLTVGSDDQVQVFDFAAGAGAYTYNIDLDTAGAFEGAVFFIKIKKAASANPTIVIRNGSGGTTLLALNSIAAEVYSGHFIFDGTNWIKWIYTNASSSSPSEVNSAGFNFLPQSPGGSLSVGSNTITLSPVPDGVNGSNSDHYLYISGGVGTAEAVLITGGSAVSGAASG